MTWLIASLFVFMAILNRKDKVKSYTAVTFAIIHLFNCVTTFEYFNFFYANIFASLSLLLYPSLVSRRDWAFLLGIILTSCILVDFIGIINLQLWESYKIGQGIYVLKYITTTAELVVLALMANGRLNGYILNNQAKRIQHFIRNLFNDPDNRAHLQGS